MKLSLSKRIRNTPYSNYTKQNLPKAYTVYNHMLLPTIYNSLEEDYHHLKSEVQIWDVSVQRQIQISGKDAKKLIQIITPRNLSNISFGKCYYSPVIDKKGRVLNDPVVFLLNENKICISIADSDIIFYLKGLAEGLKLRVEISELNIYPLAIQGPKSFLLLEKLFGKEIYEIPFFGTKILKLKDYSFFVSRSGFSKQGGFEFYLENDGRVDYIWNLLFEIGKEFNLKAGCPNLIERIEGGLLSYGNDMDLKNSAFECNFDKLFNLSTNSSCIGYNSLKKEELEGPSKRIRYMKIDGKPIKNFHKEVKVYFKNIEVGNVTSAVYSPAFDFNVAIGMVSTKIIESNKTTTYINGQHRLCEFFEKPFV